MLFSFSLQCDFVDIPDEDLAEKLKFYPEQIEQSLISLTASQGSSISHRIMEDIEADLRWVLSEADRTVSYLPDSESGLEYQSPDNGRYWGRSQV